MSEYQIRREKDTRVAAWMGWFAVGKRQIVDSYSTGVIWQGLPNTSASCLHDVPNYCADWQDCMAMQAEIGKRGLQSYYLRSLINIVNGDDKTEELTTSDGYSLGYYTQKDQFQGNARGMWAFFSATPEQRVDALLSIIKGSE